MTLPFLHVLGSEKTRIGSRKNMRRTYGISRMRWMTYGNLVSQARLSGGHLLHTIHKGTRIHTRYTVNLHAYKHLPLQFLSQLSTHSSMEHSATCQHALLHSNLPTASKTVMFIQSSKCLMPFLTSTPLLYLLIILRGVTQLSCSLQQT